MNEALNSPPAKASFVPAKKLRIAVLNRNFSPSAGGAERYSIALVESLAATHDIHVFAQAIDHAWPGVSYHRVSMPLRRPRWVNQLWFATATWWATRRGFDVVHSHENTWHGAVQTVHVLPVKHNLFHGRTGWRLALRWLKVVTSPRLLVYLALERLRYAPEPGRAVVVTSPSLLAIFQACYPRAAAMTCVITPGITLPPAASTAQQQQLRQQLGLPPDAFCLLFVGNDMRKKGLQTLLQALPMLQNGPCELVLVVVGQSAQLPQFRQQVQDVGLTSRVFFLGALQDVGPAYQAADCLVHPTLEDTFAMVVLEAMGYGLPVVVSSAQYCGISGLLADRVNALILANPRDAEPLAEALSAVANGAALATRLGAAARKFASGFEWRELAGQQAQLYQLAAKARDQVR